MKKSCLVAVITVLAAVAGATGVEHALAVAARHHQVGQFSAVDYDQVDGGRITQ